ncbi:MAG TPA: hypothetical protein VGP31_05260 [Planosporangium sp.]|nr:hypothetical protein [Planosporangium sp.]
MYPNTTGNGFGGGAPPTPFEPVLNAAGIPAQRSPWEPPARASDGQSPWVGYGRERPHAEPGEPKTGADEIEPDTDDADSDETVTDQTFTDQTFTDEVDDRGAGAGAENGETEPVAAEAADTQAEYVAEDMAETEDVAEVAEPATAVAETPASVAEESAEESAEIAPADAAPAEIQAPAATDEPATADEPAARLRPGDITETRIMLWSDPDAEAFRSRIRQAGNLFVDDPNFAVTAAATVVSEAVSALAAALQRQHAELDPRRSCDIPDTESLRVAVRRYREFLERVLAL